jgi:hypothetical protein
MTTQSSSVTRSPVQDSPQGRREALDPGGLSPQALVVFADLRPEKSMSSSD